MSYDVFGLENALMDVLIRVKDEELDAILKKMNFVKGEMHLIDENQVRMVQGLIKGKQAVFEAGGSASNTVKGIVDLGGKSVICGKVADDEYGRIYKQRMEASGVVNRLITSPTGNTGHAITLLTPDAERTFAVHLGVASQISLEEANQVIPSEVAKSKFVHLTAYQLVNPNLDAAYVVFNSAKKHNVKISFDLADAPIAENKRKEIKSILRQFCHVVFSNEKEAKAYTQQSSPHKALEELAKDVNIAIVKLGSEGSIIQQGSEYYEIPGIKVKAIDSTGAGDMYAAGILYGLTQNIPLETSGRLASFIAGKVVENVGGKLEPFPHEEVRKILKGLK